MCATQASTKRESSRASTGPSADILHEGITWTRLQAIATLAVAERGLVMDRGSVAFVSLFSRALPAIVDDRAETDLRFLRFLLGLWDSGTHHERVLRI